MPGGVCEICKTVPVKGKTKICKHCQNKKDDNVLLNNNQINVDDTNTDSVAPDRSRDRKGSTVATRQNSESTLDLMSCMKEFQHDFNINFESKIESLRQSMKIDIAAVVELAVSSAIKKELEKFRQEVNEDLNKLTVRLGSMEKQQKDMQQKQTELEQRTYAESVTVSDRTLVIKNLPETEGESTCDRVKTLFVDGLGLNDSQFIIEKAQRKGDPNVTRNYSRVVVTTLKDNDAVKIVMKSKSKLKNNEQFKKVYIIWTIHLR